MKTRKAIYLCCIMLGYITVNAQEIIKNSGPVTLPEKTGETKVILSGQTLSVTSNKSVILKPGFNAQSGSKVFIGIISQNIYPAPPFVNNTNPELNWVLNRTFNEKGDTVTENKSFFDLGGRVLQNQVKSFTTKHVLASQALSDKFGHSAIQTLAAPINNSGFSYKSDFVRNSSGQAYNINNFDIGAKLNAPDKVDSTQLGSLGWYYSNNNSWDSYVPSTGYPYSRVDYKKDGSDEVGRIGGIGEQLKMGMNRESYSGNFVAYQQLSHYLSVRKQFFSDVNTGNADQTDLIGGAAESVSRDQQGNWSIAFKDRNGKTLMTALPGSWLNVSNTVDLTAYAEQFIIDGNIGNYCKDILVKGAGKLKVYDNDILVYSGSVNAYTPPVKVSPSHIFKFKSNQPLHVSYGVMYAADKYDLVCEACLSSVDVNAAQIGQDFHYFNLTKISNLGVSGGTISLVNTIDNNVISNYTNLPAGEYKAVALTGEPRITYNSGYSNISYNFYNLKGELLATIAPNGVEKLISGGLTAYTGKEQLPFTSLFEYDKQGRLIASKSVDGGRAEYVYRKDGRIRFAQNAEQLKGNRFSYTNYDEIGRQMESGEYTTSAGGITFESVKQNFVLLENTSSDGGLTGGAKSGWARIHYDLKDNSHGLANYQQDFLDGAISWTENENSKTWYSYDERGKLTWTIKQLTGLGSKTIDYTYDFLGNMIKVAYQKGTPAESFYHYYEYDADQRLINMQTSTDGLNKLQQAKYQYYLHGPLKRVELADNLQGIDYTYTAQGWLKTINHSNSTFDPGNDGSQNNFAPDAFGMTLEYFNGDYTRALTGIGSLATSTNKTWYNGNIAGQSWKSLKPNSVVSAYGAAVNNPAMFTYEYDDKYQFNNNKYGTPDFASNKFSESANMNREHGLSYDANGNIKSLNRNNTAGSQSSLVYNYQASTNKLASVDNYASYSYNDLGQMSSQKRADGAGYYVDYNANGKVQAIYSDAAKTKLRLSYAYDEDGMRIRKTDHLQNIVSYYVYDLTGSVLAIYDNNGGSLSQKEVPLYAADRIGIYKRNSDSYQYELTDNIGNVRVVLNRNKVNGKADVVSYSDYYPFGSPLTFANNDYRYGFQGKYAEADKETGWNNFELRLYDPAIGRWLSVDPKNEFYSPYLAMGNNPVSTVDPDGGSTDDPPEKTYSGNGGKILNEIMIIAKRMNPMDQLITMGNQASFIGAEMRHLTIADLGAANQGGAQQSSFVADNWKDVGFLANDLTQSFINRNTTLAISEGYNLAKSTVFLPLGLATRTSTGALSVLSRTGGLVAKAAPWVAAGTIGINIAVNKQITAGDVYQSIVTGTSLVPGWGLVVGGGALLLEGGSYYFTGNSVSDNINSHLNGGVIYRLK